MPGLLEASMPLHCLSSSASTGNTGAEPESPSFPRSFPPDISPTSAGSPQHGQRALPHFYFFWLVKENKVTQSSYSGESTASLPVSCKEQGTVLEGSHLLTTPLAKFAQQELPYPQGR